MGKRNREKRAAKAKQRARRGPTEPRADPEFLDEQTFAQAQRHALAQAVRMAAQTHVLHGPEAAAEHVELVCEATRTMGARAVWLLLEQMLLAETGEIWSRGWSPVDVHQLVRRRVGKDAATLVADVVAAEHERYVPATVHPRWQDQLAGIGAQVWWDRAEPLLTQWAARHGHDRTSMVTAAIAVIGDLAYTGATAPVLPPPGSARTASGGRAGVDEKVLARVRALLAKAESTDYPDEAEALSGKAQELMHRYALDQAAVAAEQHAAPVVATRRMWLDSPYLAEKAHLVGAVAEANRCRTVLAEKPGYLTLVGDELDLDATELLATSLLVQANRAMLVEGRQVRRGGQSGTRSFRQSFLVSYAVRVGERLHEVTGAGDAVSQALVPVFAARAQAVDSRVDELFPELRGRGFRAGDASGWAAGRAAANRANLTLDRASVRG
ncbi:hypothetical protein JOF53_005849 [Crossiella equi]|uniref:DUF2786 domain-containing protein n=1 Tax=Crossiella equi TaxID=130796 RepID=A0ABS5AK72_9PSEU|nr:DUF2786 domain-containing protein [Crossiella equi]MBP2476977.1 hypothetical protein [Crossiella equi]